MKNEEKIREAQILEQNLHNLLLQKQAFEIELSEVTASLKELENAGDEVFKIVGQMMMKTDKTKMKDELLNKKKVLGPHIKTIDKQKDSLTEKLDNLRKELTSSAKK